MTRWMGVDLGSKRIGISISDSKGVLATPYTTIQRTSDENDANAVAEMAAAEGVKTIVVGYPLSLDGSPGDAAFVVDAFVLRLKAAGAKVKLWDERMTTVEAEKKLKATGMKGKQRRAVVDKTAATIILQSFLDSRR